MVSVRPPSNPSILPAREHTSICLLVGVSSCGNNSSVQYVVWIAEHKSTLLEQVLRTALAKPVTSMHGILSCRALSPFYESHIVSFSGCSVETSPVTVCFSESREEGTNLGLDLKFSGGKGPSEMKSDGAIASSTSREPCSTSVRES